MGALSVLLALLLTALQAAMPFAHAMVHVVEAHHAAARHGHTQQPEWAAAINAEKPCALCAEDQLSALPRAAGFAAAVLATPARFFARPVLALSSAPLDLFCRPPPTA